MNYTHKEIAETLGIAEATVKRYRNCFPQYMVPERRGKPFRYPPHALEVCTFIRDAFAAGEAEEDIALALGERYPHLAALPRTLSARVKPSPVPEQSQTMMALLETLLTAQQETNQRLASMQTVLENIATPSAVDATAMDAASLELRLQAIETVIQQLAHVSGLPSQSPAPGETPSPTPADAATTPSGTASIPETPPDSVLALPMTVLLADGEYVSVAGRSHGPITLQDVAAVLAARLPHPPPHGRWASYKEGWEMYVPAAVRSGVPALQLHVTQHVTPRGNAVCVLQELTVDGSALPPASFYTVYRQLQEN